MLKEIEFTDIRANLIIDLIKEQGFIIKDIDTKKTKICEFMNILIDCLENVKNNQIKVYDLDSEYTDCHFPDVIIENIINPSFIILDQYKDKSYIKEHLKTAFERTNKHPFVFIHDIIRISNLDNFGIMCCSTSIYGI